MEKIKVSIPKQHAEKTEDRSTRSLKDGFKPNPSGIYVPHQPIHEEEISERLDVSIEN